jgi:hypothetical protein
MQKVHTITSAYIKCDAGGWCFDCRTVGAEKRDARRLVDSGTSKGDNAALVSELLGQWV